MMDCLVVEFQLLKSRTHLHYKRFEQSLDHKDRLHYLQNNQIRNLLHLLNQRQGIIKMSFHVQNHQSEEHHTLNYQMGNFHLNYLILTSYLQLQDYLSSIRLVLIRNLHSILNHQNNYLLHLLQSLQLHHKNQNRYLQ